MSIEMFAEQKADLVLAEPDPEALLFELPLLQAASPAAAAARTIAIGIVRRRDISVSPRSDCGDHSKERAARPGFQGASPKKRHRQPESPVMTEIRLPFLADDSADT